MGLNDGHYYDSVTGAARYEITGKNGKVRAPYAKEALARGWFPSVTTVQDIRMRWSLVNWQQEQAVRVAYGMPPSGQSEDEYVKEVMSELRRTSSERTGSATGTLIHNTIEALFVDGYSSGPFAVHAEAALDEVSRIFPDVDDWESEQTFAHPLGFGGKVDLHSPSTGIVVDFKTKSGELDKKMAFDEYRVQLAGYSAGLYLPANHCANVFVSRTHPGIVSSNVWNLDMLAKGWDLFRVYLRAWWVEHDSTPEEAMRRAEELAA